MLPNKNLQWFATGFLFAVLWASAAVATKIGLAVAQPLVIAVTRFGLAAAILLFVAHVLLRQRLPVKMEWKQVAIYGLLNITIYLGIYVVAMQWVSAGIGTLTIASNPVFISFMSVFFLKKKLTLPIGLSLITCAAGIVVAALPLFEDATVTPGGLLLLLFSMFSYSVAAIYFSSVQWDGLSLLAINGWQTFFGGLFLLPFMLFFYKGELNHFNATFGWSVGWLAIPVSIVAIQLWLWLLQTNAIRAGLWLFLCPLFGFIFAAWWMHEPISMYTISGIVLVSIGLLLSKVKGRMKEVDLMIGAKE